MKNLRLLLASLLSLSAPALATTLVSTTLILSPGGTPINGAVYFQLSSTGTKLGGGCGTGTVSVSPPFIFNLKAGALAGPGVAPYVLPGNDCLSPSGTTYHETVTGPSGGIVLEQDVSITGSSVDVGALTSYIPIPVPAPTASIFGDVTGTLNNTSVVRLRGVSLLSTAPTTNQGILYNGSAWAPAGVIIPAGTVPLTGNWAAGAFNITSKNSVGVYNVVTGYGADPTFTSDSTAAIQNAINAANAAGGGVVYLPAGGYKLLSGLTLKAKVTLQGDGMYTTELATPNAIDMVTIDGTASGDQYVGIRDLMVQGGAFANRGIVVTNSIFVDITRVTVLGGLTEGLLVTSTLGHASYHVQVRQCWLTPGTLLHVNGISVTGLLISETEIQGGLVIEATSSCFVDIRNSTFEGAAVQGIRVEGSTTPGAGIIVAVTDSYFESNAIADIDINPSATATALPMVSIKGGTITGTAIGVRANPKTGLLSMIGVSSAAHGTADVSLGDLSTWVGTVDIPVGNRLLSTTKILSTNPTILASSFSGVFAPDAPVGAPVSSNTTVTPTGSVFHVTGVTTIQTINLPYTGFVGPLTIIPDGIFATGLTGNIGLASTSVVGKALVFYYDAGTSKWYPSY